MKKYLILLINLQWVCSSTQQIFNNYLPNSIEPEPYFSYDPSSPNSPDRWEIDAPNCGGQSQSPINIQTEETIMIRSKFGNMKASKWSEKPSAITIINKATSVEFGFTYVDQSSPIIYVNGNEFIFAQLHFHFGLDREFGSEHYINKRAYAMEGHAVFYNRKYATLANALTYSDGLAVIGRLYDENEMPSHNTVDIDFDFLRYVRNPSDTHILNGTGCYNTLFSLEDIMGPIDSPYYEYHGSLTTPNCEEVVTWYVAAKPLQITTYNLFQFRQLLENEGLMAPNFRPLQEVNQRPIYYHQNYMRNIDFNPHIGHEGNKFYYHWLDYALSNFC